MKVRIFDPPPENVDETWTHGAMVGGMIGYGELDLADSYFLAGDTLIDAVAARRLDGREIINPVLFVYRHGIELYLKHAVDPATRNHNLGALLEAFCGHVRDKWGETVPRWITKPIAEFIAYDPASTEFRYETDSGSLRADGEFWIDLPALKRVMARLRIGVRRVIRADEWGEIPPPGVV